MYTFCTPLLGLPSLCTILMWTQVPNIRSNKNAALNIVLQFQNNLWIVKGINLWNKNCSFYCNLWSLNYHFKVYFLSVLKRVTTPKAGVLNVEFVLKLRIYRSLKSLIFLKWILKKFSTTLHTQFNNLT